MKRFFEVKPVGPAFNPAMRFVMVEAASPKEAAEQVVGRNLSDIGDAHQVRARVKQENGEIAFYLPG